MNNTPLPYRTIARILRRNGFRPIPKSGSFHEKWVRGGGEHLVVRMTGVNHMIWRRLVKEHKTNSHRRNGLSKMKEYKIPSNVVRDVKKSAPSVGRVLWEIVDCNARKEESRRMGFVKTHDAKCCEFIHAGGMFYCSEITTCPYYNKIELDRKCH